MDQEKENKREDITNEEKVGVHEGISGSTFLGIVVAVLVAVAVVGGALYYSGAFSDAGSKTVATVNGSEITASELDERYESALPLFEGQGLQVDGQEEEIKRQVLTGLVNETILLQKAEEAGIEITDEEVDIQFNQVREQFPDEEQYQNQLSQNNLTEEGLKENIRRDLIIGKLISAEVGEPSPVTEEEVREYYDEIVAQAPEGSEIPPFEEISETLHLQLENEESGQAQNEYIDILRNEADIEIFI